MFSPRRAAVIVVDEVLQGRSLDAALSKVVEKVAESDRGLTAELSYGVCRWFYQLDAIINQLLTKRLKPSQRQLHALLLIGCYQILHTRIPPHAAVAESVETARQIKQAWATGLVNAVLRRLIREQHQLLEKVGEVEPSRSMLPKWLLKMVKLDWPENWEAIAEAFLLRPPMTLRVNVSHCSVEEYADRLSAEEIAAIHVAGVSTALTLDRAAGVDQLPGFNEGDVSVQDAGAQLAALLLDPQSGDKVLDACAAPGGKSCHILEYQPDIGGLTAVDVDENRLLRVQENLDRIGLNARLVAADVSVSEGEWRDRLYDRILLDVPCSATGVIRRHPDIRLLRKAADIDELAQRQGRILDSVWTTLKPGGVLLYCTCSILAQENQMQISEFLKRQQDAVERKISVDPGRQLSVGIQILPGDNGMDGFYYACLEKSG